MVNPIMQLQNQRNQTNAVPPQMQNMANNMKTMFNMVRNSGNPMGMLQNIAMQNPRFQQAMQYANMFNGDAKSAFYNAAQQKGIDPNSILNMFR